MTVALRPYQVEAAAAVQAQFRLTRDVGAMLVMATGCGKTVTGLNMAQATLARPGGRRVLWLAHRNELVSQPVRALCRGWPEWTREAGIVQASQSQDGRRFVAASVDTLAMDGRLERYLAHGVPALVIWDEAHHSSAPKQRELRERLAAAGPCWHLGLTATPEGLGLAELWRIVYSYDIRDAQRAGYLLRENIVVDRLPDLEERDFATDEEEGAALLLAGVVEHTVRSMLARAQGRHSLVFTATVEQAQLTAAALSDAGFRAAWVSGNTGRTLRAQLLRRFERGDLDALVNAAVLTEGTDLPRCDAVVLARSCKSRVLYVQTVGRGLRPYGPAQEGFRVGVDREQQDCLVLDLAGASLEHDDLRIAPVLLGSEIRGARGEGDGEGRADDGIEGGGEGVLSGMRGKREPVRACWVELEGLDRRVYVVGLGRDGRGPGAKDLGTVIVAQDPHTGLWGSWHAVGNSRRNLQPLVTGVVLREAQAMGNDLVRRAGPITSPFAPWRRKPASEGLCRLADRLRIGLPEDATAGRASDLINACLARKQVLALRLAQSLDLADLAQGNRDESAA